jgi:hypothetical protein
MGAMELSLMGLGKPLGSLPRNTRIGVSGGAGFPEARGIRPAQGVYKAMQKKALVPYLKRSIDLEHIFLKPDNHKYIFFAGSKVHIFTRSKVHIFRGIKSTIFSVD